MDRIALVRDANGKTDIGMPIPSSHRYSIKLAAATKNTFTIPIQNDGNAGTGNPTCAWVTVDSVTWLAIGANVAVPAANVVDGTGPIMIYPGFPRMIIIPDGTTQISVISTPGGFASFEWHDGKPL